MAMPVNVTSHEAAIGARLDNLGRLYGIHRQCGEPDAIYRWRILREVPPPPPTTIGEHLDRMEKLYRFFHASERAP